MHAGQQREADRERRAGAGRARATRIRARSAGCCAGMLTRIARRADPREAERRRHRDEREQQRSVSSSRMTRPRPAPSASRTAISRRRSARAREHQVGDVGARDQQDDERGRLPEREERSGALVQHPLRQRVDAHAVIAVGVGVFAREAVGDARPSAPARPRACVPACRRPMTVRKRWSRWGGCFGSNEMRRPDLRAVGKAEPRRRHADRPGAARRPR